MGFGFSQNGYTAGNTDLLTWIDIPGGRLRVRKGPIAAIFTYLAQRFNDTVEPIKGPVLDDWGYAYRDIRDGVSLSNHASGTAIDLNATQHPLGKVGTFSRAQVRAIRAILADLDGVVRWGGDYSGRKDEMHFEINADARRVTTVAAGLEDDMYTLDQIAHAVQAYDGGGKLDAWRLLRDARNASQAAARDAAATLAIAKAQAAAGRPLTAAEVEAAAKAGAKAAIDEEIDSATVELNVGGQA